MISPAERNLLLAAAAAPLRWSWEGGWCRTDLPAPARVDSEALELLRLGLLQALPNDLLRPVERAELTYDGEIAAAACARALGRETRELLRQIDDAGELVRRERCATQVEVLEILAAGGVEVNTITEWVRPISAHRWLPDPADPNNPLRGRLDAPVRICGADQLADLAARGLVLLLAGGTRAVITGAGRWCGQYDARRAAQGSEPGEGAEGAPERKTTSEGPQRPSKEA